MGQIAQVPEVARLVVVDARGDVYPVIVDITGPVIEAAKSLDWARAQIEKDGGKVQGVSFGTLQDGTFRVEERKRVPIYQQGYRRMSAFLRA